MREAVFEIKTPESLYEAHQSVWKLVGGEPRERDFLFRVRPSRVKGRSFVKVRSASLGAGGRQAPLPEAGRRYAFSVLARPIKRGKTGEHPLRHPEEIDQWVKDTLARHGMRVETCDSEMLPPVPFGKRGHDFAMRPVEIFGVIEVTDGDAATTALWKGVGRDRAMGFGMIEIEVLE